jgi:hypothetical protein
MKIIVNERQYSLIKGFIDEVKGKKYPKDIMNKLGKDIVNVFDEIGQGKTTEFQLGSGNKVILKCISDDNYVFKFEIIEDTSKALKKWDILEININPGNGDTDGTEKEYKLNSNIIEPAQNGNGFTLIFQASKKTGPKGKVKLNAITKISPSSVTKKEEPKPEEKPEEPKASGDTEQPEASDKLVKKADRALTSIQDDPLLKKAFYEQPGLMKLFFAELQNKKAVGKGIITVLDLLQKYTTKKMKEYFIENREVTIVFGENYNVKYGKNDEYSQLFSKNVEYPMLVMRHELAKGVNLKSKKSFKFDDANTISLILTLDEFKNEEQDEFYCELSFYVEEQDENNEIKKNRYDVENEIIIKVIRGDKSLGYNVKTEQK